MAGRRHIYGTVFSIALASGCTPFPDLDDTITSADRDAAFPLLINLDTLLSQEAASSSPLSSNDLESRLSALQGRATALRGRVLSSNEQQRLLRGVALPAPNG